MMINKVAEKLIFSFLILCLGGGFSLCLPQSDDKPAQGPPQNSFQGTPE